MILVTGASGFLGQHLVHRLSGMGKTVRALYHKHPPHPMLEALPGVTWQACNLLDVFDVEDAFQGITHVFHCAAMVSFHPADKETMMHFNVESTSHVVNECLEQNIQKLIHVSSIAALGRNRSTGVITEMAEWEESNYNSAYSNSKYLSEMEVWRGIAEGLNAAIVNPAIILGEPLLGTPENWNTGSARLMKVVHKEFPFYTQGINGWVDVQDVVTAMILLMEADILAERFIVSAGNFSYREIFTLMAEALHKRPPHIPAGKLLSGLVWRWNKLYSFLTGKTVTVTRETAITANKKNYYDNKKLIQLLPEYQYTPLKQTISRMASQFLQHLSEKK